MKSQIKLSEIQSLSNNMNLCLKIGKQRSLSNYHQNFPHLTKLQHSNSQKYEPTPRYQSCAKIPTQLSQIKLKLNLPNQLNKSSNYNPRRSKDKFCGDLMVSKKSKPVFKKIVQKYKRSFHPTNASRGKNDTSNQCVREPKKSKDFRQSMLVKDSWNEIRYYTKIIDVKLACKDSIVLECINL